MALDNSRYVIIMFQVKVLFAKMSLLSPGEHIMK